MTLTGNWTRPDKTDTPGDERQFHHHSRAWWWESSQDGKRIHDRLIDEVTMGIYPPGGGTTGEFSIQWENFNGSVHAQFRAYSDAWAVLAEFDDLMEAIPQLGKCPSPDSVCAVLVHLGITDATPTERPASAAGLDDTPIVRGLREKGFSDSSIREVIDVYDNQ